MEEGDEDKPKRRGRASKALRTGADEVGNLSAKPKRGRKKATAK